MKKMLKAGFLKVLRKKGSLQSIHQRNRLQDFDFLPQKAESVLLNLPLNVTDFLLNIRFRVFLYGFMGVHTRFSRAELFELVLIRGEVAFYFGHSAR